MNALLILLRAALFMLQLKSVIEKGLFNKLIILFIS